MAAHPGTQRLRDLREATCEVVGASPAWPSGPAPPHVAELSRVLASDHRRLGAALRQIDDLLRQNAFLKEEVALLGRTLTTARQFAFHDELTGLPNRRLLLDRFNHAMARGQRQHKHVALIFLDVDGFKRINDAFGHPAGDRLLQQVAARLVACVRSSDTVCRYGGDEFVVLLSDVESREDADAAAQKICARLAAPYEVNRISIKITTSIGTAVYPLDGDEYGDLIRMSDLSMYQTKGRTPILPKYLAPASKARH